jgi:ABC-type antimicrobial peptide transport system permease subunit
VGSALLAQFLFQIAPTDPLIYAGSAALVVSVAGLAALAPARRAAAIAPATVLRAQ